LGQIRIETRLADAVAECRFVHTRRAGSDHHAVEIVFLDVALDLLLTGVGAGVFIAHGHRHVGQRGRVIAHRVSVHATGDVQPAVTDKDANAQRFLRHIRSIGHRYTS